MYLKRKKENGLKSIAGGSEIDTVKTENRLKLIKLLGYGNYNSLNFIHHTSATVSIQ